MKAAGIVLIAVGLLMLIFRGFSFTKDKKVVDLGPLEINKEEKHSVGWPVYAGGIAVAAGVIVLVAGKEKIKENYTTHFLFHFTDSDDNYNIKGKE